MPRSVVLTLGFMSTVLALNMGSCRDREAAAPIDTSTSYRPTVSKEAAGDFNHGLAFLELRRNLEAEASFTSGLRKDPGSIPLVLGAAIARYYQGGDMSSARAELRRLINRRSELPAPHYIFGHIRMKEGKPAAAVKAFTVAGELSGWKDAYVVYSIGLAEQEAGRHKKAVERFKAALALLPGLAPAWYSLGQSLLDLGQDEEGRKALERFDEVRVRLWSEKFEFRYRGMGDLMMVPEPGRDVGASAMPSFTYRAVREPGGARAESLFRADFPPFGVRDDAWMERHVICPTGSGAAVFDADGDGDLDVFEALCRPGGGPAGRLLVRGADGSFTDGTRDAGLEWNGRGMGVASGDIDGDGDADLAVASSSGVKVFVNSGKGRFSDATGRFGVEAVGWCTGVTMVDFDHDGDLDFYVSRFAGLDGKDWARPLGPLLFRNEGMRGMTDMSVRSGIAGGPGFSLGSLWLDLDQDNDFDVMQFDTSGPTRVMLNQRDGTFEEASGGFLPGLPDRVVSATVADLNGDGLLDLAFTRMEKPVLAVMLAGPSGGFRAAERTGVVVDKMGDGPGFGIVSIDPADSGRPSLLVSVGGRIWSVSGFGKGGPEAEPVSIEGATNKGFDARGFVVADLTRNGQGDLVVSSPEGALVAINERKPPPGWLRVGFLGQEMSSRDGYGTIVDARLGPRWQAVFHGGGGSGYLTGAEPETLLYFGNHRTLDFLRLTWPSGIRQPFVDLPLGREIRVREQGMKSSCPLLFTWNGRRHVFVSDLLGASSLGLPVSEGIAVQSDDDELIMIPEGAIREENRSFRVRLVEHLEEVLYTDRVRLVAVDHPKGTEVVARERYQFLPPRDRTGFITLSSPLPVADAFDDRGNRVADVLARRDLDAVDTFDLSAHPGFASPHHLTLDLGEADPAEPVLLVLDGWVRYATMEEMKAAARAGIQMQGPSVEVEDDDGRWRRVIDEAGFPAGRPKTMVLDLTGAFESRHQKVRLTSNLIVFWDRVRVDRSGGVAPFTAREIAPSAARLWRSGYPLAERPGDAEPLSFDGDHFRDDMGFDVTPGMYTRLGDVTELLTDRDDMLVVMSHGEAIDVEFDAAGLPGIPEGYQRSFAFLMEGWMKDREPDTISGEAVGPLPRRGMSVYPIPASKAADTDESYESYLRHWNTRRMP